jgi:hypothetical protein
MIHIVFQRRDIGVLNQAMDLDESLRGEVIPVADDYSLGPISDLLEAEAAANRRKWWSEVLLDGGADFPSDGVGYLNDQLIVGDLSEKMQRDPTQTIWIWAAQNNRDVSGYFWLVPQLRDLCGRVFILYLNNLPFINAKGNIFYPISLNEIPAKEFLKAKKLARPISASEFEVDSDEWLKLGLDSRGVRILEGGKKLSAQSYDFYDEDLKKAMSPDWQRASKIIHHFLSKSRHSVPEGFLFWRLKQIALAAEADAQGELGNMKDFELKLKVSLPVGSST